MYKEAYELGALTALAELGLIKEAGPKEWWAAAKGLGSAAKEGWRGLTSGVQKGLGQAGVARTALKQRFPGGMTRALPGETRYYTGTPTAWAY